jgi:transposase InsO family protein
MIERGRRADAADGHRGDLSAAEHVEGRAGAQNLPVSAARAGGRAAEPSLGHGYHPRVKPEGRLYIPMARGFVYLAAVIDWFSRRVLSWRLSVTMEADFCLEAAERALARYGRPEIFNTDQGSQFTSAAFTGRLLENVIAISMDGRGTWRDNVFVKRLWRSVKYEEVYLRAYDSVGECR